MGNIVGLVLAAGESKRMGFPKMLLDFEGVTMIEKVISNIKLSEVDEILVVLGANMDLYIDIIERSVVRYCKNDNYSEGMLSSVRCGFGHLPTDCEAVMIFPGDQPLIGSVIIDKIIVSYKSYSKGIIMPVYNKKRGHPLLIDRKYFSEVDQIDPSVGLRRLSALFPDDVMEVETDDSGVLKDFNTYKDYREEINLNQ